MEKIKSTQNVLQVLAAMMRDPDGQHYALELSKEARISIGTIYSVLARLEQYKLVSSTVEDVNPSLAGRPARRYYLLTGEGQQHARNELRAAQRALSFGGLSNA